MSLKKLKKKLILYLYKKGKQAFNEKKYLDYKNKYEISSDFRFNGENIIFYGTGRIVIDGQSYIGSYSTIQSVQNQKVSIGKNCQISHNVRMYTSSAEPDQDFTIDKIKPSKLGNITIGDGVWIGANVYIGPGITIHSNAVVGANSVVTKDIPSKAIVGGVPAKLIRFKKI